MDDLFGHVPQQSELFAPPPAPVRPYVPNTPDTIRAKMLRLLAELRAARTLPWSPETLHSYQVRFPNMAEWLPKEEGDQLLMEFRAEVERLGEPLGLEPSRGIAP